MYKVLIIEDENIIREGLKHLLNWTKLDCVIVKDSTNGKEGLEDILKFKPDILLLDINIPLLNGLDVLKETYDKHVFSTIIISGYDDFKYAKRAIKYGVTEYLLKPIKKEELKSAVIEAKKTIDEKRKSKILESAVIKPDQVEVLDVEQWIKINRNIKYLDEMIDYIQNNYYKKISINDISEQLGISVTYLNKNFKKGTTFTFNEFLNRYRIEQAIKKIKNDENKITIIAEEVGFKNYRYFISVFKKYTNYLPSDFSQYGQIYDESNEREAKY